MIKTIVESIMNEAEKIDGIKFFRYEGQDYINAQNNNSTIQVWVEDDIYCDYIVTKDIMKVSINIDILDKLENKKLDVHNDTFKIAVILIKLLEDKYKDIMSIYDYSLMTVSHYTDDDLFGTRMTLIMYVPSPINECNLDLYLDESNKYEKKEGIFYDDIEMVNIPIINIDEIDINPIKLKRNE